MGAINSAFNQAVGAAAGAALAIKHAKESDFSKMNTADHAALVAKNQAVEAEAAAKDAQLGEQQAGDNFINSLIDKIDKEEKYNKVKNSKDTSNKAVYKKLKDLQAAQIALDEASNKIDGIQAMKQRALDQRAYADKASKIAQKAQQKYQSKWEWGGK